MSLYTSPLFQATFNPSYPPTFCSDAGEFTRIRMHYHPSVGHFVTLSYPPTFSNLFFPEKRHLRWGPFRGYTDSHRFSFENVVSNTTRIYLLLANFPLNETWALSSVISEVVTLNCLCKRSHLYNNTLSIIFGTAMRHSPIATRLHFNRNPHHGPKITRQSLEIMVPRVCCC